MACFRACGMGVMLVGMICACAPSTSAVTISARAVSKDMDRTTLVSTAGTTSIELLASDSPVWYDCAVEEGIESPVFAFSDVFSEPSVVTKNSGQTVHKNIYYNGTATLPTVSADFHQFYKVLNTWWTFLHIKNINQCHEHPTLCPLHHGQMVNLTSIHPPLNPLTPYGWYRSRQIYRNQFTGDALGCVDMHFEYREK
mmetsp:Transcript_85206/g.138155  ORF Transcript_85206/g.138155 Transcript_85206/m.138155 type:complete len:198 (+) Transcript_85206:213-806(+)|eukprot:CAMPEP_0179428576 /NCGR_PEP_ID=MMETSP0799-20121207/14209_1 /TAXON_ID=46947 /ORGANISM="Geminigera cryophila, Strain CCMP2564" /LENGTH=197 /DNA_ID=CAMNT_0021204131 /DNA_START=209 /DNA_END=802 /DNA_ORIENTATION=+